MTIADKASDQPLQPLASPTEVVSAPGRHVHLPALDGLRGLAILLVMFYHFFLGNTVPETLPGRLLNKLASGGWAGVDLFFVLSGFLITGILFDAKNSRGYFRNFYMKRALRIFPLYYGVLVGFFLISPLLWPLRSVQALRPEQSWLWLYVSNIRIALAHDWLFANSWVQLNQFWSLAIEEQFYLLWPAVVLLLSRHGAMRVCLGAMGLALLLRVVMIYGLHDQVSPYVLTPCRFDGLALGSLLALAIRGRRGIAGLVPWAKWGTLLAGGLLAIMVVRSRGPNATSRIIESAGFSTLAVLFGSVLILTVSQASGAPLSRLFRHPWLRFFGKYSYGLYVFHCVFRPVYDMLFPPPVLMQFTRSYTLALILFALLAGAASVGVALASWHFYEKHFLKLKRYFETA